MKRNWAGFFLGVVTGATLGYLFDRDRGRRRRAYLRDQLVESGHRLARAMRVLGRDLANRAYGLVAEAGSLLRADRPTDAVLAARVRAAVGRVVSHPHAIDVAVSGGVVRIAGPILAREVEPLLAAVQRVRGVRRLEPTLEPHRQPNRISALQGESPPRGRPELAQEHWSPTTRLIAGMVGARLIGYALARRGALGLALGLSGGVLLARGLTNLSFRRLTGIGAGHRAVDFHRTIEIHAPVEEVFSLCADWERLAALLPRVRSVRRIGEARYRWEFAAPASLPLAWEATITRYEPNRLLAWKTLPGAAVRHAGILHFEPQPHGTTRVDVQIAYNPPGGAIGHGLLVALGLNPQHLLEETLVRFKSILEVGKTTVDGREITRAQLAAG